MDLSSSLRSNFDGRPIKVLMHLCRGIFVEINALIRAPWKKVGTPHLCCHIWVQFFYFHSFRSSPIVLLANALANQIAGEQSKSKVENFYATIRPFRNMRAGSVQLVTLSPTAYDRCNWIIDFFIFILLSRESGGGATRRTNPDSRRSCLCFQVFLLNFVLTFLICCLPDSTKQR